MFLVGVMSWWYNKGLVARLSIITNRVRATANLFSIRLLISTLFSPYKQISAEYIDGSIHDRIRAFFDRLLSRVIGAVVRSFMIIAGILIIFFQTLTGGAIMVAWLIVPFLPILGLILWVIDWRPL